LITTAQHYASSALRSPPALELGCLHRQYIYKTLHAVASHSDRQRENELSIMYESALSTYTTYTSELTSAICAYRTIDIGLQYTVHAHITLLSNVYTETTALYRLYMHLIVSSALSISLHVHESRLDCIGTHLCATSIGFDNAVNLKISAE